jgi:ferredoxin-NADP reductase
MDTLPLPSETLTFVERIPEYGHVSTYVFKPAHLVPFTAGQYAHIRVLNLPEGTKSVRELSFASAPHEALLRFGVDGRSGSAYQKALQVLKPGDTVELFKIKGHMTWPPPTNDVVMIAGGVGVTPFRSMLLDARERALPVTATLIHAASGPFLYESALRGLVREYVPIRRQLLAETLARVAGEHPDAHYYIAGSNDFVAAVAGELARHGIERIESDEFKGLLAE